jgi:hypothetical protein
MYKIRIEREVNLENVFVTAIEGGSNYWCCFRNDSYDMVREVMPKELEPCFSVALYRAVVDFGVKVPVYDAECDDDLLGVLDSSVFQKRLDELALDDGYRWALQNECDENGDAESSDLVFQYLLMGDVVYS